MLPNFRLSSTPVTAPFIAPDDQPVNATIDYELGGVALNDPSQGLRVKTWTFSVVGNDVIVSAEGVDDTTLFSRSGITAIAGAFDQNMKPAVAFVTDGQMTLFWFDSLVGDTVFTDFDGEQPRMSLDDKRFLETGNSDVIFAYLRGTGLYFRAQRDRYLIEYFLASIPANYKFSRMGMNSVLRMQFLFEPSLV